MLLSTGSFTNGYHLEFAFDDGEVAHEVCELLATHDILAHISNTRVYIKDSESICNLLALIGATKSLYTLNDQIVMRSVRNTSNRRANCDTANIDRQIKTAHQQIELFKSIQNPPKHLKQIIDARLENPEASYDELATILGISKSGIANRIQSVIQYVDGIKKN